MEVKVKKGNTKGKIAVIPSKSYAHRILLCSALSDQKTRVKGLIDSKDILATINALKSIGAEFGHLGDEVIVSPITRVDVAKVFCDESGSTLRFLLPVISALGLQCEVDGKEGLRKRPIKLLLDVLRSNGAKIEGDSLPIKMSGSLKSGKFIIDGSQSSQNLTGLMYALTLLDKPSEIVVKGVQVSTGYIDITLEVMRSFGARIEKTDTGYMVYPTTLKRDGVVEVEGDYSSASFLFALGALTGEVEVVGLNKHSKQGDKEMIDVLKGMGADIEFNDTVVVKKSKLHPIELDATDIPDLIPIISVCCAFADGVSRIKGVDRLKIKESDRLQAIIDMLGNFGIKTSYERDVLYVYGGNPSKPSVTINGYNDHRIVMSASVFATAVGETVIKDMEAIRKSYPTFFEDLNALGGDNIAEVLR